MWNWKFYIFWCNGRNDLVFGIFFSYCEIIISFLELFSAACFLCILQAQWTRRNTSISKNVKKRQHMTFMMTSSNDDIFQLTFEATFVNFIIKTYSTLLMQYMYKFSCKMDKHFLRCSKFFQSRPTTPTHHQPTNPEIFTKAKPK